MYERLYKRVTESGITLDKCIQPAVDFNGKIIGLVAGDEQCFEVSALQHVFFNSTQFACKLVFPFKGFSGHF